MDPTRRRYLVIFVVAFTVRAAAAVAFSDLPLFRTPALDSREYLDWAQAILASGFFWPPDPSHAPGYPFFLAALLWVLDGSLPAVAIAQSVLGALTAVLTGRLAERTVDPRAAIPAGLLVALHGPLIYLDTALLAEPLFILLVVLAINLAVSARDTRGWVMTGVAIGLATIVRPTGLALVPVFAIVLGTAALKGAGSTASGGSTAKSIAAMVITSVVFVAPVVVQNWRVTGVPSIQGFGGLNAYLGNSPSGDGMARARPGRGWDELAGEADRAGAHGVARDRYYLRRTFDEISAQPTAFARLLLRKTFWTLQAEEIRDTHSFYFFAESFPVLTWLPGFGVVLALTCVGLVAPQRPPGFVWLLASLVGLLLTVILFVVGTRYRAPIVPVLCVFAGRGCVVVWDVYRARERKRVAVLGIVGIAGFMFSHLRAHPPSHNLAEEWSHTGLAILREGNPAGAEAAYRRALALEPESPQAWNGLYIVHASRGDHRAAADAAGQAVRFNPLYATAWYHQGLASEQLGERTRAIQSYRRALEISPDNPPFLLALGEALLREGSLDEAAMRLRAVVGRTPDDGRVHLSLALIEARRQRWAEAVDEARRATVLLPSSEAAWELLARAAIGARMPDVADSALTRAEQLGMNPQSVATGREIVRRMRQ